MNNYTKHIPYTLFYRFIQGYLIDLPVMRMRYATDGDGEPMPISTYRTLRHVVRNVSTGTNRKEDVALHRSREQNSVSQGYMGLPLFGVDGITFISSEFYVTSQNGMRKPILWSERCEVSRYMPRDIVFTDRGWLPTKYFKANPHLRLYVPMGLRRTEVSWANFVAIDRDTMRYDPLHGWLDHTMEVSRRGINDISSTWEQDGIRYPISDVMYCIKPSFLPNVRLYARGLVRMVMNQRISLSEASVRLRDFLRESDDVYITIGAEGNSIPFEQSWRAFYLETYQEVSSEVARIVRGLTQRIVLQSRYHDTRSQLFEALYQGTCPVCSTPVYAWNPHETVQVDAEALRRKNYARYRAVREMNFYCSEEHAMRDSTIFAPVDRPERMGYHTNVLNTASIGRSTYKAPDGNLRRVGIELETFMPTVASGRLPNFVIGGTMKDKKLKTGVRPVKWHREKYAKWGAIPTRDGSLSDTYGVEWVFRPSDLKGLREDVHKFLTATKGHIARDGTAAHAAQHSSANTYGLHVHVTATDTMEAVITRLRMVLVGSCLAPIIHAIGGRGYSNYTRMFDGRFLNMNTIKLIRERQSRGWAWVKHISPFSCDEGNLLRALEPNAHLATTRRTTYTNNYTQSEVWNRYNMMNVSYGKPTIEMRHGKGIVDEDRIMMNAELAQAVVLFATYGVMSMQQCSYAGLPLMFAEWVLKNDMDYPLLATWIWYRLSDIRGGAYVVSPEKRTLTKYTGE